MPARDPAILVTDLYKRFGDVQAVHGVSFAVQQGEIFSLLGPNGAGKSTTISMLACLLRPNRGQASIMGHSILDNPAGAKAVIGVVPQEIALYEDLTARENLEFWGKMYGLRGAPLKQRVDEVLELVELSDRQKDRVGKFSGGMKRRINIGVALLHRPPVLILDEPTVGIDPQSRRHILDGVLKLNREGTTVLLGLAFGGFAAGDSEDPRLPVGLLDQDGSDLSSQLASFLTNSAVIRVEAVAITADELGSRVGSNTLAAGVIIPTGYGDGLRTGTPRPVTLVTDSGTSTSITVQGEVDTAVRRLTAAAGTARLSADTLRQFAPQWGADAQQAAFDTALERAMAAWAAPPASTVSVAGVPAVTQESPRLTNAFAQSSPGMMVQFAIAGLMSAAGVLVAERRSRCLPRLLTTNMSRVEILGGHFLAMFVIIFGQLLLLALFGQLFLGLSYTSAALATLLLIAATALFAASLGLLIGALAKSQEQVIIFSLLPMFVLAGFGGAWVPLEFTPAAFQRIAHLTPLAWSMIGLQNIIVRGQGLAAVLPALAVLLAYSVTLLSLAVWRFRFE